MASIKSAANSSLFDLPGRGLNEATHAGCVGEAR